MSTPRLPAPGSAAPLRDELRAAAFTADGCLELLGAVAYAALSRAETVPALRATRGGSPLETLVRLFLLQQAVPRGRARAALKDLERYEADGWLQTAPRAAQAPRTARAAEDSRGDAVRATVDVRPYAGDGGEDWWIVSDLGCSVGGAAGIGSAPGVDRADLVLGVGGASTTLAGLTVRQPFASALDLGTGSGVQALHASRHTTRVTATDVNPRALHFARLTLALSGAGETDLRQGGLFEPVAGERYDLIVSNPPFVISPGNAAEGGRLTYRDGGMAGDDLCRSLVQQSAEHLNDGGWCQLLANWQHVEGQDWRDRLASWVPPGCDAWIVQREVQDVAQYAELWLRDGGDHRGDPTAYAARYDAWLAEFEHSKVNGIGFGWITLRRSGAEQPVFSAEEWPHPVEQPLGPHVADWFTRQDFLRAHDDAALLAARFTLAPDVVQEQVGLPGAEDPEHVVLRSARGMRRATKVDTVGAGFAGVCDGTLPAGRIVDAIAQLLREDPVILRDRTPESIRLLVEQGFLEPVR
ncbi:class I SAM-dependent methyltransferase [Actinacidiphila sp. ITFR-21]|uniref:class I SAM-dependent methyltransferase n=1 Tax=Actinacidiphila sp. ITFR-21 TaxID=3075199 RepID=UPI00288C2745|nr:class I SAM-dependent methyltransferase [Streptomyces sp. ITFR-21]WNI16962.1 class I SAM-dependent methyltransferase [Streptomyces sp. ITFR-21]